MRTVVRVAGWILVIVAIPLVFAGIVSLPPGGLMFALPFFFLVPGIVLGVIGTILILVTRRRRAHDGG
jgi:hypothetical protein